MRFVFSVLGLALVVLGMGWGNADYVESVLCFVDIPSLVLVFVGTIAFTLATHTWREVVSALGAGLSEQTVSAEEAAEHIATLKTGRGFALGLGGIGALIGLVGMLASLEDPAAIGPAMAISLLSTFYGVFIAEICLAPLINRLVARTPEVHPNAPMATANRRASAGLGAVFGLLGLMALLPALLVQPEIGVMVDTTSVVLLVGLIVCWGLANHRPAQLGAAMTAGVRGYSASEGERKGDFTRLSTLRILAVGSGVLGLLIGMVKMLSNMDDSTAIGPALAVACLMPLYGLFVGEVLIATLMYRVGGQAVPSSGSLSAAPTKLGLVMFGPGVCLGTFLVYMLAMACFDC